jgi:hypothetical protein
MKKPHLYPQGIKSSMVKTYMERCDIRKGDINLSQQCAHAAIRHTTFLAR